MIVIKIGGSQGVALEKICRDIAVHVSAGREMILVHGGSAETNEFSAKLGFPPRFVTNTQGFISRYTDRQTLEIFAMVTNGRINTLLVETLQKAGVNAFGLSGLDGRLMVARRKDIIRVVENGRQHVLRDDYTGKIETVNREILDILAQSGFTPVISPLAISPQGEALNVDADRAAAYIAGSVRADQLIILSNVPGLLRDFPDESSGISYLPKSGLEQALAFAEGRMKKKILGAREALDLGVSKVVLADGRVEQPITQALAGNGTVIS